MKKKILLFILALTPVSTMAELSVEGLDLRLKGVGYRWVQDFESGEDKNAMRLFTQFGITKQLDLRVGWNRHGINSPLDNGHDSVMFEIFHKID